jgi:hypothetical protein
MTGEDRGTFYRFANGGLKIASASRLPSNVLRHLNEWRACEYTSALETREATM